MVASLRIMDINEVIKAYMLLQSVGVRSPITLNVPAQQSVGVNVHGNSLHGDSVQ